MSKHQNGPAILRPNMARTHRTEAIRDNRKPSSRTKASYGPDVQIAELTAFIHRALHQIANHVQAKRYDKAGKVCEIVSTARARLVLLVQELDQAETLPEPAPILTKPKHRTVKARKVYGNKPGFGSRGGRAWDTK